MTRSRSADLACANRLRTDIEDLKALRKRFLADRFLHSQEDKRVFTAMIEDAEEAIGRLMLRCGKEALGREGGCRVETASDHQHALSTAL